MPDTVVVAGSLAQRPGHGGHTWVFLQYLLGFKRLGYDVLFLDWIEPGTCVDAAGHACSVERSSNLAYLVQVMDRVGLSDAFSLSYDDGRRTVGLSRQEALARVSDAALVLNVMGFLTDPETMGRASRRVFLDIDPGFPQMWRALGLADQFTGHDAFVTIGENIGRPSCPIPTCGLEWITTPQPIVLDDWPPQPRGGSRFTSIASWRGLYGPVEYGGKTYGLRVHEFRTFVELPRLTGQPFELALDIHLDEVRDLALLSGNNWLLVNPREVAGDPWAYQAFIQQSGAEFGVAKNMYVQTCGGWLSDRSICYLASGKPVIVQDTGLGDLYPTGEGLLTFSTLDEAVAAVSEVARHPDRHARVARAVAEEYFDSDTVLRRLLAKLGL